MKLESYRTSIGIGPVEAARQLNVGYLKYWRWEEGKSIPLPEAMDRIVAWSGGKVTANDFYEHRAEIKRARESAKKKPAPKPKPRKKAKARARSRA